jgi:hypothetical protein
MSADGDRSAGNDEQTSESSQPSQAMSLGMSEPLPDLHLSHRKRNIKLLIGLVLAILDLCCLPITYFYALNFDTNLNLQDSMILAVCNIVSTRLTYTQFLP